MPALNVRGVYIEKYLMPADVIRRKKYEKGKRIKRKLKKEKRLKIKRKVKLKG
jgi:hypothetical protein